MELLFTAIPTKVLLLPALPTPLWYLRAEAAPVLGSRVGLEAMCGRRRGQSHMPSTVALRLDWGGWGICAFQGSRQIKKVILLVSSIRNSWGWGFFQLTEPHPQELLSSWEVIENNC